MPHGFAKISDEPAASTTVVGVVELATVAECGTGTDATRAATPAGLFPAEATIASAAETALSTVASIQAQITGVVTITSFGTVAAGIFRRIRFAAALTLTHNATSLILPGGANIVTAANDRCGALSLGSGNWIVMWYVPATGKAVIAPAFADITSKPTTLAGYGITDAQGLDAELTAWAGLASAADKLGYFTGSGTAALADFTAAGRAILDDATAAAQATTLGLGTGDSPQFTAVNVGHATDTTLARSGAGDLTVEGNAIYRAGGTDVPLTDGGTGASDAATARTNLGLGTIATQAASAVAITGGTIAGVTRRVGSISVEDPTNAEDISVVFTPVALTLTKMVAVLVGSATPSVTWTIRHSTDRSAAGNEVVTGGTVTTSTTTGSVVTSFNDATIPADSFIWFKTTAKSGTVDEIHITLIGDDD